MDKLADEDFYHEECEGETPKSAHLPILDYRSDIIEAVRNHQFVIIHGETGCGKTTQIPQYLYEEGLHEGNTIGITQPRRIAAVSVTMRVAYERSDTVGKTVGYAVRFDKKCNSSTKIKYMTEGVLLNECLFDKWLKNYKIIMIDEAHERSLMSDVLLGLLKLIAVKRKDLKVIVSSATMSVDKFREYFADAKVITITTRLFPVKVIYDGYSAQYINTIVRIVQELHSREMEAQEKGNADRGHILAFLTGRDEIDKCCKKLRTIADVVLKPLYGAIDFKAQKEVFDPVKPYETKVVVATNIAETSLTIEGIKYVIDCGYVRQKCYDPKRGMENLGDVRISKAQAEQRKGRAGRTQEGECYRLYGDVVYESMSVDTVAEIYRRNLSGTCLLLRSLEIDPRVFHFLDKPNIEEIERSETELVDQKLMTRDGRLTVMGDQVVNLPVDLILGKVLMTSLDYKCTMDVIRIVSMFSENMHSVFKKRKDKGDLGDTEECEFHDEDGDHFSILRLYKEWKKSKNKNTWCYKNKIDPKSMQNVENVIRETCHILKSSNIKIPDPAPDGSKEDIKRCFTEGYFKNICILQRQQKYRRVFDDEVFCIGNKSTLSEVRPKIILFHEAIKSNNSFANGVMQLDEEFLRHNFEKELNLINFPANVDYVSSFI